MQRLYTYWITMGWTLLKMPCEHKDKRGRSAEPVRPWIEIVMTSLNPVTARHHPHICEEAKRGNGTVHEGVVRWFEKSNMLKATGRLFEQNLTEAAESEYNLNDHIAKFEVAKILIEHDWWPYAMIDSSVTPSKKNRPNDMSICIRNTEEDLLQACEVCNEDRKETCKMCRALMHQRWFDIILWHKQTTRIDTSSNLTLRFLDPQSMLTTSTVSRVALNATISYSRRNFLTTTSIKKEFEDAGIEVDNRSQIMTNDIFEKKIGLPHAYSYIVRMIPSCTAGDLNSVLHGLGSTTASETKGGIAKMNRLATHQEVTNTYFRQDHTAAFQSGTSRQLDPDLIFGLQGDDPA